MTLLDNVFVLDYVGVFFCGCFLSLVIRFSGAFAKLRKLVKIH